MKPFIKWQGGKRRELKHIREFIPNGTSLIAEPFAGGAAVAFDFEGIAHLNDINTRLINLYKVVANPDSFYRLLKDIAILKVSTQDELERRYYEARSYLNQDQTFDDPYQRALAFLILRQQCFSGMERYNKSGEFNVPWGRYKSFSCCLDEPHQKFLQAATITNIDACDFLDTLPAEAFVFVDPPYLDRAGYEKKDGGYDLHTSLAAKLINLDLPFLLVHSDHEFYRYAYRDFKITEVPFKYAQQFNRGNYDANVNHLYITNI
jgi:DNA adenine methylase